MSSKPISLVAEPTKDAPEGVALESPLHPDLPHPPARPTTAGNPTSLDDARALAASVLSEVDFKVIDGVEDIKDRRIVVSFVPGGKSLPEFVMLAVSLANRVLKIEAAPVEAPVVASPVPYTGNGKPHIGVGKHLASLLGQWEERENTAPGVMDIEAARLAVLACTWEDSAETGAVLSEVLKERATLAEQCDIWANTAEALQAQIATLTEERDRARFRCQELMAVAPDAPRMAGWRP
jgi:hypothetical protein